MCGVRMVQGQSFSNCCKLILALVAVVHFHCSAAEIYRWKDAKGKTHWGDERSAPEHAVRVDPGAPKTENSGNQFVIYPEADTMMKERQRSARGESTALSAGYWKVTRNVYELTSIMRFDLSDLLAELGTNKDKKIIRAELKLFANTQDKIHPRNNKSESPEGHYSNRSDNSFFVTPVRSSWDEHSTMWQNFYNDSEYTPMQVRKLPFVKAPGSENNNALDYTIDLSQMITQATSVNMRALTLELKLQRRATLAVVTFFSREAALDVRPRLEVTLSKI